MTADKSFDLLSFTESFLAMEYEENLFSLQSARHCYWEYIRYGVYYSLLNSLTPEFTESEKKMPRNPFKGFFKNLFSYFIKINRHYDLVFLNAGNIKSIQKEKGNIYNFNLIAALCNEYKILVIDITSDNYFLKNNYPCEILFLRSMHLWDRFKARYMPFAPSISRNAAIVDNTIRRWFHSKCNLRRVITSTFRKQLLQHNRFRKIFNKTNPKILFYSDNGNIKGVIEAARTQNIYTVDIQHSLISKLNIIYNYKNAIHTKTLSEYFYSFGEYWHGEIRVPIKKIAVGFPYFEMQRHNILTGKKNYDGKDRKIIVVSTGAFSRETFVKVTLELATEMPEYKIYFKLRNDDYQNWEKRYPAEFKSTRNLIVVDNDSFSLYEYFAECNFQIGISSTALFEGIAFGLTTFVIKTGWYKEMEALIGKGNIFLVESARAIAMHLRNQAETKMNFEIESLFKSNSISNFQENIRSLFLRDNGHVSTD